MHEFDKVEILAYATPKQAPAMHDEILAHAEGTIRALGLAYRVVDICAGDLRQLGGPLRGTWSVHARC